jgi:hypothetical protein
VQRQAYVSSIRDRERASTIAAIDSHVPIGPIYVQRAKLVAQISTFILVENII